ncbi:MAG: hypothetical protein M3405_16250 [Acidobacteriota bacterium]|nr:hypothetical protein [Acidobacteriota bacterium]
MSDSEKYLIIDEYLDYHVFFRLSAHWAGTSRCPTIYFMSLHLLSL